MRPGWWRGGPAGSGKIRYEVACFCPRPWFGLKQHADGFCILYRGGMNYMFLRNMEQGKRNVYLYAFLKKVALSRISRKGQATLEYFAPEMALAS